MKKIIIYIISSLVLLYIISTIVGLFNSKQTWDEINKPEVYPFSSYYDGLTDTHVSDEFANLQAQYLIKEILRIYDNDPEAMKDSNGNRYNLVESVDMKKALNAVESPDFQFGGYTFDHNGDTAHTIAWYFVKNTRDDMWMEWAQDAVGGGEIPYEDFKSTALYYDSINKRYEDSIKKREEEIQYYNSNEYLMKLYRVGYEDGKTGRGLPSTQRADAWESWITKGNSVSATKQFAFYEVGYEDGLRGKPNRGFN